MRGWLAFQWKRRSLERSIEKISRLHSEELKKLKSPTHEQLESLHSEFRTEQEIYEDELTVLTSSYLTSVARRMFVPVPEFNVEGGAWVQASTTGKYHLNAEALSALRSAHPKGTEGETRTLVAMACCDYRSNWCRHRIGGYIAAMTYSYKRFERTPVSKALLLDLVCAAAQAQR